MAITIGSRLRAQNSACEVLVVKGAESGALACGGVEMTSGGAAADAPQLADGPAIQIGKRYTDEASGAEVLCTKAGLGPLTIDGRTLTVKATSQLPSSD
ncbi:hypothetical protein ABCS02_12990 [Microbacterium sp. X-17]|uniref:hypothetical protein n=1 Tax=Microbacterium sp. X-17 TaxID=3144404 RepID=UPI0031F5D211